MAFVNRYAAEPTSAILGATKVLEGRDLTDGAFRFVVTDANGERVAEGTNLANGRVVFDALHFDGAGTYEYTIAEVVGREDGMTYDRRSFRAVVEVVDNGTGALEATVNYPDGDPVFTNRYEEPQKPNEPVTPPPTPSTPGTPSSPQVPVTGDATPSAGVVAGVGALLAALAGAVFLRLRSRKAA